MEKNEPAFPSDATATSSGYLSPGLTKREYFAGLAMGGLTHDWQHYFLNKDYNCNAHEIVARASILLADALLEELEKE